MNKPAIPTIAASKALIGRELDAAVARQVFGLRVVSLRNAQTKAPDAVYLMPGKSWARVPFYAVGTPVMEYELSKRGWIRLPIGNVGHEVMITLMHADGRQVIATGGSFAEALCRAALKAVAPS